MRLLSAAATSSETKEQRPPEGKADGFVFPRPSVIAEIPRDQEGDEFELGRFEQSRMFSNMMQPPLLQPNTYQVWDETQTNID